MKISWIVPVFNPGVFLDEAVMSILSNSVANVEAEILLVDDCSTESLTLDLLRKWSIHPDVKVIRQPQNGGPARARNAGMRAATGDWLAYLDADDILAAGSIALRAKAILNVPTIAWIAGDMVEIREPGKTSYLNSFPFATRDGVEIMPHVFLVEQPTVRLAGWPMLPFMGSMMFRRSLLEKTGFFEEKLIYGEDIYFCLILSLFANLYWIDQPSLQLRRYHESMTKNLVRGAREAPQASLACLRDPRLQSIRREMRWHYAANLRQSSGVFAHHGLHLESMKAALKAILVSPNDPRGFRSLLASFSTKRKTSS
ncbi:glycosyltransferase family 2 protein [Massilia sp. DWR3-1-1]|uniref:glycosyltransferase family 2 protein n=1 Tax=Massilia sp. DWR3-1-1 TaxID=2804559 RepID=UPI003CF68D02